MQRIKVAIAIARLLDFLMIRTGTVMIVRAICSSFYQLVDCVQTSAWCGWYYYYFKFLLVDFDVWVVWLHCLGWLSSYLVWFLHGSLFWSLGVPQTLCCFWGHALLGELVLQSFYFNDWQSRKCRDSCGCFVHMYVH